jgi:hypothetical protein
MYKIGMFNQWEWVRLGESIWISKRLEMFVLKRTKIAD